jgi:hypothetical protein
MKPLAVLCATAVLVAQSGCAGSLPVWTLPAPPSEELRRSMGPLAVVTPAEILGLASSPPPGACARSAEGALSGMGVGLKLGVFVGHGLAAVPSHDPLATLWVVVVLGLAVTVSAVGAVGGGLVGALLGLIGDPSLDAGDRAIRQAVTRAGLPEALRRAVLEELARETEVQVADPARARTLLLLEGPVLGFAGPAHSNPPLRLFGEVRFRLVRAADGAELHALTLGFRTSSQSFIVWTSDEAEFVRRELLAGTSGFAARAVQELFRVEIPHEEAASGRLVGPAPVETQDADELRWMPVRGVEDVVYDVRIVNVQLRRVVYERDGLIDAVHRLEEPFPWKANLQWTVRARYRRGGRPRCTPWTAPEAVDRDGDSGPDRQPGGIPFQNPSEKPRSK